MIYINEKRAGVTCNVFKALKSLRQMDEDIILWIDAICINQNNNEEKGQQVGQMRLVYESAEEVIIWLGESDANIEILFECAWKLDKAVGNLRKRSMTYEVWKTLWDDKEKERLRFDAGFGFQHEDRRRSALRNLLGRPWFRRVWIIQVIASSFIFLRYLLKLCAGSCQRQKGHGEMRSEHCPSSNLCHAASTNGRRS